MSRLLNKVAIVTGAASNPSLGRAIALRYAEEGASLVITDIDVKGLADCERSIKALGVDVLALQQDVTDENRWQEIIAMAVERFGKIDILVNNAGIAVLKNIDQFTMADYDRQMNVNMRSVFLGCQKVLPIMEKNGGGSIVNMSSVAGLVGMPGVSVYGISKAGVAMLSKSIAIEYAGRGVRCNSIHPGVIETNIQLVALRDNPKQYEVINASIPMGRMGQPAEVANCALFLGSDESSYVTGVELVVDGGVVAQ